MLGMEGEMLTDKALNKEVAVVVTSLQPELKIQ